MVNLYITLIALAYLLIPVIIINLFRRYRWAKSVGTVILAYAAGIIPALFGWLDFGTATPDAEQLTNGLAKVQGIIMNLAVPIAIPLMLFNCNFKLWTKSLPKTTAALVGGLVSVLVAVVSGFFIFRNFGIDNPANVAAMMTGIYTGGTMNFNALGVALNVDPSTIATVLTFEMLVTFPLILFIVGGGYKLFRRLLPFHDESTSLSGGAAGDLEHGIEQYDGMMEPHTFGKMLLGLLLSIGFLAVGAGLSLLLTHKLNELVIILTITTLSIIASFSQKVRDIPKTFELGMFFILIFSIVVASQFNLQSISASALGMFLFVLYIMVVSVLLHLLISYFCKVDGDLFCVSHVALLCSPPFVPPVVGALGNKKVLISGIVVGLIGYAIGTYLGVLLSWLLGLFV